ncbi:SGNH/GDSL hydrolase family protein [Acinetobacter sp. ANC 4640]
MQTSDTDIISSSLEQTQQPECVQDHLAQRQNFLYVLFILLAFSLTSIWIMQNSVNAYFQQTYHKDSPFAMLDQFQIWHLGGEIGDYLYRENGQYDEHVNQINSRMIDGFNQDYAYTPEYKAAEAKRLKEEQIKLALLEKQKAKQAFDQRFILTGQDQVFFAGDSMMQGVAPHVQKVLEEKGIQTVNLSKQSTGLTYPKFFDWPKTIRDTLNSNPRIKVMIVFLGPNDPWDMFNTTTKHWLTFKSSEWEAEYRARIDSILNEARKHHVSVMWLTPPNMHKDQLNEQMIYLNQVIQSEVQKAQEFVIDSRPIVGGKNNHFAETLNTENGNVKMRSADGIHFTVEGQKIIAHNILQYLHLTN